MKAAVLPNTLAFDGILDEVSSFNHLVEAFEKLKQTGMKPPVNLDFSKVSYANSAGIVTWLKFTQAAKISFKYINAPIWLVNQFNMIRDYFQNGSYAESIEAPYFSPATQESRAFTLQLGKDIPLLNDYTNFVMPNRNVSGRVYEIDFSPELYFSFISENYSMFKELLK